MNYFIYYTYFAFFALGAANSASGITLVWFDEFFPAWSKETILSVRFAGAFIGGLFLIAKMRISQFSYIILGTAHLVLLIPINSTGIVAFLLVGVGGISATIFHNTQIGIVMEDLEKRKKVMNLAQLMFGLGAAFFPFAMFIFSRAGVELSTIMTAGMICLAGTFFILIFLFKDSHANQVTAKINHPKNQVNLTFLGIYLVAFFLYAGVENGLTGYLHSWVLEYFTFGAEYETYLLYSLYWLSLTGGRLWGYFLSFRMSSFQIVMLNSFGMIASAGLIISGQITIGVILLALNVGPMFANLYLLIYHTCGTTEQISSATMTASVLGSMLIGAQLNRVLNFFFQVIILLVVIMATLVAVVDQKNQKQQKLKPI